MNVEIAVVPIAGLGTRLLPISLLVAKEFLPLGKKPAIQHIAEELASVGVRKIIFVESKYKTSVCRLFNDRIWSDADHPDVEIVSVIQNQQLGLGHAILCAREFIDNSPFIVALGDCLVGSTNQANVLSRMIKYYERQDAHIAISFEQVSRESVDKYGVAKPKQEIRLTEGYFDIDDIIEKPRVEEAPSNYAVCGRYVLPATIIDELERTGQDEKNEIQLTDAMARMIQNGSKAIGIPLQEQEKRYDVGGMNSYVQSFVEFAMADPDLRPSVNAALLTDERSRKN